MPISNRPPPTPNLPPGALHKNSIGGLGGLQLPPVTRPIIQETPRTFSGEIPGVQRARDFGQALNELGRVTGMDLLGGSSSSGGGGGSGSGSIPPVPPISPTTFSTIAPVSPSISAPTSAGADAAFARAKDLAGKNLQGSLKGLSENLASRGLLGGGLEAAGRGEVIGQAGAGLNEVIREQAIQEAQAADRRASEEYQGRITQRGQDISQRGQEGSLAATLRGQDISQRGQDIQVAQEAAARKQQALQGLLQFINPEMLF